MTSITYAYDSSFRLNCLTNSTIKSGTDINVPVVSTYDVHKCSTNLYSSCSTSTSCSCSINSFSHASTSKQNDSSNSFITMAYRPSPLLWHPCLVTFWVPVRPQTSPCSEKPTQQSSDIVSTQWDHRPATYGSSRGGLAHCHLFLLLLGYVRGSVHTHFCVDTSRRGVSNSLVILKELETPLPAFFYAVLCKVANHHYNPPRSFFPLALFFSL